MAKFRFDCSLRGKEKPSTIDYPRWIEVLNPRSHLLPKARKQIKICSVRTRIISQNKFENGCFGIIKALQSLEVIEIKDVKIELIQRQNKCFQHTEIEID